MDESKTTEKTHSDAVAEITSVGANESVDVENISDFEKEEYLVEDYARDVAIKVLSTQDDETQPAFTFRFLFLGFGLSAFGSVLAQIYYFKPQTVSVAQLFLLLISYFLGNGLAWIIPRKGVFGFLNPGPFNIKEHTAIIIMCSTASVSATASEIIAVEDLFYNHTLNPGLAIFMLFASQLLGYGFAGILRDFLVFPTQTWWPTSITSANVLQALHFDRTLASRRVRMFWIVFGGVAVWEIVPQYMFPVLSGFSIICLIANGRGDVVRNLFGGASNNEGTGLLAACFDWNYIGSGCLWQPLQTQLNQDIGLVMTYIFMMALYYGNVWKAKNFPFMSQALFNEDGSEYNQTLILTNNEFDSEKYAQQGPAYFSASNAWFLLVSNLALGSCLVHVLLWHWNQISGAFKFIGLRHGHDVDDPHHNVMKKYKQVPQWWFILLFLAAFATAQATNYKGDSGLPWWALIVLLIMCFILTVIYGYLDSITGFALSWFGSGFFQMIVAFMVPGKPVANMYGTLYGQNTMNQALSLMSDFKLGQYTKLPDRFSTPPFTCSARLLTCLCKLRSDCRVTFFAQIAGTIVGGVLNYIMLINIIDNNRPALLSLSGTRLWSGQNPQSYNSNAISWGALGPEMFGRGGTYVMVPVSLAIGLVLPVPFWLLHKKFPKAGFNYVIMPIVTQYSAWLTVGINTSIMFSVLIGIFTQYFVRRRYPRWFSKDGGTQVMIFILSFAVFGAAGTAYNFPTWWGNPSLDQGLSADRCKAPPE
ncbi:OPT oligopeptide transporter [Neolentinus lepideus HHB14362 ss-1]|uniref:OPT oligopeptide transporter n=1 Tax=Neolentinus lepideus HHB14362 ss-1 TaxID=1314782 RepID=A0A165S742_9AGAM|nr:OPT oligopeptide transporter [Neolentinus lepideus HHB14362 ss-1]